MFYEGNNYFRLRDDAPKTVSISNREWREVCEKSIAPE